MKIDLKKILANWWEKWEWLIGNITEFILKFWTVLVVIFFIDFTGRSIWGNENHTPKAFYLIFGIWLALFLIFAVTNQKTNKDEEDKKKIWYYAVMTWVVIAFIIGFTSDAIYHIRELFNL